MVTLHDPRGETHFRDEEAKSEQNSVERAVRLGMSVAGLMPRGVDLPHFELAGADFSAADIANTKHAPSIRARIVPVLISPIPISRVELSEMPTSRAFEKTYGQCCRLPPRKCRRFVPPWWRGELTEALIMANVHA